MKTFSIIFVVALVATTIVKGLEHMFGTANVFFGALALLPVCFVWMIIQDKHIKKKSSTNYKRL